MYAFTAMYYQTVFTATSTSPVNPNSTIWQCDLAQNFQESNELLSTCFDLNLA